MKKITRRQFLTSAGATSAALLLSSLPHAAAADENCLRKVTPAATNSNDLSWDMAEEILTHISDPVFPAYTVNVLDYGAVPNDGKLDTAAIQRAIDETSAHGGGTVVIPSGVYDVGAITLKSNVNLHLESKDTILRFTRDITPANYPLVFAHYEGSKLYNWSPLIYAYQQENIALTGKGTLDGQADKNNWWNWSRTVNPDGTITKPGNNDVKLLRKMTDNGTPAEERIFGEGHYLRPNFYQPIECTNVLIEGVTIANSPMWELNPVLCTNFTARGVTIDTHGYNNDGCDPENCNYVLIENCFFNTGDDCIAVKAGRNRDGRELGEAGHPTQNLIIRNNTFADGHGGIACGSEMSGGIKNLFADNNTFDSPTLNYALRFKTNAERGGAVENIYLRNSKVKSVGNAVVHATMLYDVGRDGDYLPQFKNITIENLTSSGGEYGIFMEAFEEVPITGLVFRNVNISNVGTDIRALNWEDPVMENVTINGKTYPRPVETKILGVPVPGQRIEGSSTLLGGEDTDLSSKWLISDSADGDYHFFRIRRSYAVPSYLAGKYIKFVSTDRSGNQDASIPYKVLRSAEIAGTTNECRAAARCLQGLHRRERRTRPEPPHHQARMRQDAGQAVESDRPVCTGHDLRYSRKRPGLRRHRRCGRGRHDRAEGSHQRHRTGHSVQRRCHQL